MEIRPVEPADVPAVFELLVANGWRHRIGGPDALTALLRASQVADAAILEGRVVGFVRAITDGLSNGYLSMVVVAPEHRGQGIGRRLVEHAIGANPAVTWVLRTGREGAAEFFSRLGFEASSIAMERRRA